MTRRDAMKDALLGFALRAASDFYPGFEAQVWERIGVPCPESQPKFVPASEYSRVDS